VKKGKGYCSVDAEKEKYFFPPQAEEGYIILEGRGYCRRRGGGEESRITLVAGGEGGKGRIIERRSEKETSQTRGRNDSLQEGKRTEEVIIYRGKRRERETGEETKNLLGRKRNLLHSVRGEKETKGSLFLKESRPASNDGGGRRGEKGSNEVSEASGCIEKGGGKMAALVVRGTSRPPRNEKEERNILSVGERRTAITLMETGEGPLLGDRRAFYRGAKEKPFGKEKGRKGPLLR